MHPDATDAPSADGMQRVARLILNVLDTVLGIVLTTALTALVLVIFANVVARYGFGSSYIGALDLARWLFITVILLGIPMAHRNYAHVAVSLLVDSLPEKARHVLQVVTNFIIAYTTLMLMFAGADLMRMIGGMNVSLGLPQWTPYLGLPISCALTFVYLALRGFDEGKRRWEGVIVIAAAAVIYGLFQEDVFRVFHSFNPVWAMGVTFAIALAIGTPVSFAMLFAAFIANFAGDMLPAPAVVQNVVNGSSKFLMLAIPFFILAGALMNAGGLTSRLMDFAYALVGHFRGGMAQVNILSSALYAGVSGSSYSDAAMGTKLLVPQMVKRGYSAPFSCAVTAAGATLPNIIPPSIALLLLAATGNLSVGQLWLAGLMPGALMAVMMMGLIYFISIKRGYAADTERAGLRQKMGAFVYSLPVLSLAFVIIGGIRFGIVTPTEAGVLAVVFSFLLGTFVYRSWTARSLYQTVRVAAQEAALIGFLIGAASPFAFVLIAEQVPQSIADSLPGITDNKILLLLMANVILLIFGMLLDTGASILVLTPLLMPAMVAAGVDPIHFGVVIVVNLMIGGLTPPVGMLAFITSSVSRTPVHQIFRALLPFLAVLTVALMLITYIPWISIGIGHLLEQL